MFPLVIYLNDPEPTPRLFAPDGFSPARAPKNRLLLFAGLVLASFKSPIHCAPGGSTQSPNPLDCVPVHVHTFPSSPASGIKYWPYWTRS